MKDTPNQRLFLLPVAVVVLLFLIKYLEYYFGYSFSKHGVFPRSIEGFKGIFLSPFIHGDWKHLTNNSVPLLVLMPTLLFFYRSIALEVLMWSWLTSGLWLWTIGRPSFHIGASTIVYALASFLFFSGLIRRHTRLMAISLFVVFLYGGMVWGILPMKSHISWEGHLSGAFAGLILAYWFRNNGPPKQIYQYEIDELMEEQEEDVVNYEFIPKNQKSKIN